MPNHHPTDKYGITAELIVRPCVDDCGNVRRPLYGEQPAFWGVYGKQENGMEFWVADFASEAAANLFAKSPKMLALLDEFCSDVEAANDYDPTYVERTWPDLHSTYLRACAVLDELKAKP